jgi:hypothetical protein
MTKKSTNGVPVPPAIRAKKSGINQFHQLSKKKKQVLTSFTIYLSKKNQISTSFTIYLSKKTTGINQFHRHFERLGNVGSMLDAADGDHPHSLPSDASPMGHYDLKSHSLPSSHHSDGSPTGHLKSHSLPSSHHSDGSPAANTAQKGRKDQ